jgi:hypothetical protein
MGINVSGNLKIRAVYSSETLVFATKSQTTTTLTRGMEYRWSSRLLLEKGDGFESLPGDHLS